MIFFSRFLSILPSRYPFYAYSVPCSNITLGGGNGQADGLSDGFELLGVKVFVQGFTGSFVKDVYPLRLLDEVHVDDILVVQLGEMLRDICFTALTDAHNHQGLVPGLVFHCTIASSIFLFSIV